MIEEKEIHLRDYVRIIKKRKQIVATFFLVTFATVFLLTLRSDRTPQYIATTKALIEKNTPSGLLNDAQYFRSWDPNFLETQLKIMTSSSVCNKIVDSLDLNGRYKSFFIKPEQDTEKSFTATLKSWLNDMKGVFRSDPRQGDVSETTVNLEAQEVTDADIIAMIIGSRITVKPERDSNIVNIGFKFENPVLAERIANAIIPAYIEELFEMRMRSSEYAIGWMTKKAEEERKKLQNAEKALHNYMKMNDIFSIEDRIAIIPEKVKELSSRLTAVETRKNELKAITAQLKGLTPEETKSIPVISAKPIIQTIRARIIKAEQDVVEKSKKFGRKHPVMIRSQNALTVLKEKHTQEINRLIREIQNEYELTKTNVDDLNKELSAAKIKAVNLNEKYIQYKILKRDVETNRHIYNALVSKIKEQTVAKKVQRINAWTVEKAETPSSPIGNNVKRNILLGIILGLFGGIGLAFFIEYLDNTIKYPEDAEEKLGLPVIGLISLLKTKEQDIERVVKKDPFAPVSENYRSARTSLMLSSSDKPPKIVLITSMTPKEGKTTTVVNIAEAIASMGKKVLVIDGDLRRPRVHKIFGLPNKTGLSSFLAGVSDTPEIVNIHDSENLSVLPSGPIPPAPSELLSSAKMEQLISDCNSVYDFILLDSPPVLSVTDSLILSKTADTTLVVVRSGKTTYELATSGIKSLLEVNANLTGMLINCADLKKDGYHYYGYGYYSYSQEED